jgi:HSP20 family protein
MAIIPVRKGERGRSELARLHDEMDDLISGFFGGGEWPSFGRGTWPAIDIADRENDIFVKAEVPGCKAADIDISVHGNVLTISGEKKEEEEKTGKGFYHIERGYGSFRRDLHLPSDVEPDKIEAVCKDGVLSITLPKAERSKAVRIKVKEE